MITKLPNQSTLSSEPLWLSTRPPSLKTIHRTDYRGHFHSTKIPGPQCLIAKNKKFKVSAYLSTLPLSPPDNIASGNAGKTWLADSFESREVKWRRDNCLHASTDSFDTPSNYQIQFYRKPIENRVPYISKHIPIKTMEKFDSISTYNTDYLSTLHSRDDLCYTLQKRQPTDVLTWTKDAISVEPPFYRRRELPPLESDTSYRTQFPSWSVTPRGQFKRRYDNDKPLAYIPFDSESIYQADFKGCGLGERPSDERIISSCGVLNREVNQNQQSLVPYLECQRPMFYTVKDEN